MRLTTRTSLAFQTLMFCAVNEDRMARKAEVAAACNASLNHLGLVISQLAQHGFLSTARGRNGGFRLSRPAAEITLGEVCRALESDVPFTDCFPGGEQSCPLMPCCPLQGVLNDAVESFYATLDAVTLEQLVRGKINLRRMLTPETADA